MNNNQNNGNENQKDDPYRVAYLIAGYIQGNLTHAERTELDN